tara:strand:+ start:278 stop:829 length:552 start_codon:yes stop_codon:yes gene_type:complete
MKTHWLKNPNKNYLGNWDLPDGKDVILTIESANWEAVKNPVLNTNQEKRVIRFTEKYKWIKPFIVNEINAKSILKCTGIKYMEDSFGMKIKIGVSQTKVKREEVDCLRVRNVSQKDLEDNFISSTQLNDISSLIIQSGKLEKDICYALSISNLKCLHKSKFDSVKNRLNQIISEKKDSLNEAA